MKSPIFSATGVAVHFMAIVGRVAGQVSSLVSQYADADQHRVSGPVSHSTDKGPVHIGPLGKQEGSDDVASRG
jgi:hypothetical protein